MKEAAMLRNKLTKKTNKSYEDIHLTCTVRFLDDSEPLTVTYQKDNNGQWLVDHVCKELNLLEKDYFGLRFVDSDKQRHWLDPVKTVHRQLKNVNPPVLCFRVKFYPSDPLKLKEEITRYFLFLQLRRDLHHGRLLCSPNDANEMAAYIIQSELGDYDPQDHAAGYVAQFKMLPKQTQKQEEKIAEFHKNLKGEVPSEAETNFLQKAAGLETFGVDPHPVKPRLEAVNTPGYRDQKGNQMYLGVTHLGIVTFQGNKRTHLFKWPQITKIAFEGKMFIVHVIISEDEEKSMFLNRRGTGLLGCTSGGLKKHACGFKCATFSACKHLWKCAVEQQYFFTLANSSEAKKVTSGGSFFTRGSKFRFSGRCQQEVYSDSENITRDAPSFNRSSSNPAFMRSFNKRSASMPNKLKDRTSMSEMSDVTMDSNHVTLDSLLVTSTPLEDHVTTDTIPEESVLELGDSPYRPTQSPTSEEMPPFPGVNDSTGPGMTSSPIPKETVSKAATLPFANRSPLSPDLDAQIQELQHELEQYRKPPAEGSEQTEQTPVDEEPVPEPQFKESPIDIGEKPTANPSSNHINVKPTSSEDNGKIPDPVESNNTPNGGQKKDLTPTEPPVKQTPPKSNKRALLAALAITLLTVGTFLFILAVVVLETNLDAPGVTQLRNLPEVQDFNKRHYSPFKESVSTKVDGIFKG